MPGLIGNAVGGAGIGGVSVLSTTMDTISQVLAGGFTIAVPIASTVAAGMLTMGGILFAWGLGQGAVVRPLGFLTLKAGFFLTVIKYAGGLYPFLLKAMTGIGLLVSGSSMTADQFLRSPDALIHRGYATANGLFDLASEVCKTSYFGCFGAADAWFPISAAGWGVAICFIVAAVLVMCCALLCAICFLLGIFLLPAELFEPTHGYGQGPFRIFLHSGMQLASLAFVTNVMGLVATKMIVHTVPGVDASFPFIVFICAFIGLLGLVSTITMVATQGGMQMGGALLGSGAGMLMGAGTGGTQRLNNMAEAKAIEGAKTLADKGASGLVSGAGRLRQAMRAPAQVSS